MSPRGRITTALSRMHRGSRAWQTPRYAVATSRWYVPPKSSSGLGVRGCMLPDRCQTVLYSSHLPPTKTAPQKIIWPMATYLARPCLRCDGYFGIVLRANPDEMCQYELSTGTGPSAIIGWPGLSSMGRGRLPHTSLSGRGMLDPTKARVLKHC
jgi:hypothetical protein